nr:protein FAR1-related sequence 5-like [Tanacetum cinerariifolium]
MDTNLCHLPALITIRGVSHLVLRYYLMKPRSFSWMLEAFLKTHKKQPPFAVTDQDGAIRNVVVKMFPDSHHRLCMWHITEKLVLGDLAADNNFRKDFHKLVWNLYIGPDAFEQRWNDMVSLYNLHDNKWLSDMSTLTILTELPFEKHACDVYTPSVFKEGKNVVVDDEDEGDTDDQFDNEALGATEDEFDEDDEIDDEFQTTTNKDVSSNSLQLLYISIL